MMHIYQGKTIATNKGGKSHCVINLNIITFYILIADQLVLPGDQQQPQYVDDMVSQI